MQGEDKITKLLESHFSGFEHEPPENDHEKFRKKFKAQNRKNRFFMHFSLNILVLALLVLSFPEIRKFPFRIKEKTGNGFYKVNNHKISVNDFKTGKTVADVKPGTGDIHLLNRQVVNEARSGETVINSWNLPGKPGLSFVVRKDITTDPVKTFSETAGHRTDTVPAAPNESQFSKKKDTVLIKKAKPVFCETMTEGTLADPGIKIMNTGIYFRISFSVFHASNRFSPAGNRSPRVHEDYSLIRNKSEKNGVGYSLGINLGYCITRKFGLTSGLFYEENRDEVHYDFYNNKIPVIDSATNRIRSYLIVHDTVGTHMSDRNIFRSVEIPIVMLLGIYDHNRLSADLHLGGAFVYSLAASGVTISSVDLGAIALDSKTYRNLAFAGIAGLCVKYRINKKYSIGIEPFVNGYLAALIKGKEDIIKKTRNQGFNMSLLIQL